MRICIHKRYSGVEKTGQFRFDSEFKRKPMQTAVDVHVVVGLLH